MSRFTAAAFANQNWPEIAGHFDELATRPLEPETVDEWLADWSALEAALAEAASRAQIAYTCDTTDPAKEAAHRRFSVEIAPLAEERSVALARRLVALGSPRTDLEQTLARFRRAIEIFREANVPLAAELEETANEYRGITGGFLAEWRGEQLPLPRLAPFLQDPDRAVREAAFRATTDPYVQHRDQLAALFDRQVKLRSQVAANADFADYQAFAFASKFRFDYGPEDCAGFHRAVEEVVVPAVAGLHQFRQRALAVDRLRPWDLAVTLHRKEPLRPFRTGAELADRSLAVFRRLDRGLAGQFQLLIDEGLLDLDSRAGKAPGGYCDTLHEVGRPFVFMNAAGIMEDVQTMFHEAGHAFHAFASHRHPLVWQRHPTSEAAELASMSMELLAYPLLDCEGGFLSQRDAAIARVEHFEDVLITLCHIASVDAFQAWIYSHDEGRDAAARDHAWLKLRARFEPIVDWTGLEAYRAARWYRQLHLFLYPFYYVEYGIAQLGALRVWLNHRDDPAAALSAYREFLALGATVGLPQLYRAAGARLVFDAAGMKPLVAAVVEEIARLRKQLG